MRLLILVLAALGMTAWTAIAETRSGSQVYEDYCSACHHPSNVMVSSPKSGSVRDWAPRLKKGIPGLVRSAIQGIEAMPPLGACDDCTPEEIEAAIRLMTGTPK